MITIKLSSKFHREIKILKRKFRKIEDDVDKLFSKLSQGKVLGDKIKEFIGAEIYKIRIKNSSSETGKSGGFRIIYYSKRSDGKIVALSIYSKSQKTEISRAEILEILKSENLVK